MTRTTIITQARVGSTRLPGKVLHPIAGRTVLDHHLDRLLATGLPVVVATTESAHDDAVAALAERRGVACFRGSETDVLDRFARCATAYDLDGVVRVTSDCPLLDADVVRRAVEAWEAEDDPWLYLGNGLRRTFPRGYDVEVFAASALHLADARATSAAEREHVTPYLYTGRDPRMTTQDLLRDGPDASDLRVTLDTLEDLLLLRALLEEHGAAALGVDDVVALLRRSPELVALNADVEQKPWAATADAGTRS